jgi:hypothetical protein
MNTSQRTITAAILCIGATSILNGCGNSTSPSRQANPASASAIASSTSSPLGPLDRQPNSEIVAKAITDLKAASSLHIVGTGTSSGTPVAWDLSLAPGRGCTGKISTGSTGTFQIIVLGTQVWVKPDATFWKKTPWSNSPTLNQLEGKYLKTTTTSNGLGAMADLCDPNKSIIPDLPGDTAGLTKAIAVTVNGEKALAMAASNGILTISDTTTPKILRITTGGSAPSHLDFTDYNKPLTLTPPPADEILDGSKYGL